MKNNCALITEINEKDLAFLDIEEFFNFVDSKYYLLKLGTNQYKLIDKFRKRICSDKIYTQQQLREIFQKKPCNVGYDKCKTVLESIKHEELTAKEKRSIAETFAVIFHDYNMTDEQIGTINKEFENKTFYHKE